MADTISRMFSVMVHSISWLCRRVNTHLVYMARPEDRAPGSSLRALSVGSRPNMTAAGALSCGFRLPPHCGMRSGTTNAPRLKTLRKEHRPLASKKPMALNTPSRKAPTERPTRGILTPVRPACVTQTKPPEQKGSQFLRPIQESPWGDPRPPTRQLPAPGAAPGSTASQRPRPGHTTQRPHG